MSAKNIHTHPYDEAVTQEDRNQSITMYPSKPRRDFYGFSDEEAMERAISDHDMLTASLRRAFLHGCGYGRYAERCKPPQT